MVARVAVLLGTVQFSLRVKVIASKNATPEGIESAAWAAIADDRVTYWTLVDELGVGHPVPLSRSDFLEVGLQRVETSAPEKQQPKVLWERED
jgi:hypothetical protein